jgi:hypothetical protein
VAYLQSSTNVQLLVIIIIILSDRCGCMGWMDVWMDAWNGWIDACTDE